jgi:hypothetical protein
MDYIKVQCKVCHREIESYSAKPTSCGCSNMTTIKGDVVTANDLSKVVMINSPKKESKEYKPSIADLEWQKKRSERKIPKLEFEIR